MELSRLLSTAARCTVKHAVSARGAAVLYPRYNVLTKLTLPVMAQIFTVGDEGHNVVVCVDEHGDWNLWCGDKFLEGTQDKSRAGKRSAEAAGKIPSRKSARQEMLANMGALTEPSKPCNFWEKFRLGGDGPFCEHTESVLAKLRESPAFFTALQEQADTMAQGVVELEAGSIEAETAGLLFRTPVLLEGERGSGKTYLARHMQNHFQCGFVEVSGHASLEAADLLGFIVPTADHGTVWKDGPLTEAFRRAQAGERIVLFIDELLRIRQHELSALLGALSPDSEGMYRLRTGRILSVHDGVGQEEELRAKVSNLAVIAATNVGAEYVVDEIDPALAERFMVLRLDTNDTRLRSILKNVCQAKGLSSSQVGKLMKFYSACKGALQQGLIAQMPTTRTLSRVLELSASDSQIGLRLRQHFLLWAGRTARGTVIAEQVQTLEQLVRAQWGALDESTAVASADGTTVAA